MKRARRLFLALIIFIIPNISYYAFTWLLVLKRQLNEEIFLQLPLYIDYIPEAIILVAMSFLILHTSKDFTRAGKYDTANTGCQSRNKQPWVYAHRYAAIFRHGVYALSMVQSGGVVFHHSKHIIWNRPQKEVKQFINVKSLFSLTIG